MRISYDPEVDARSIVFLDTTVTTRELAEEISAEFDQHGHLAGIEILDAANRIGGIDTLERVLLERVGSAAIASCELIRGQS